jgi:ankyrin repeat protein
MGTHLHRASYSGDINLMRRLLDRGAQPELEVKNTYPSLSDANSYPRPFLSKISNFAI